MRMSIRKRLLVWYLSLLALIGVITFYGIHTGEKALLTTVGQSSTVLAEKMLSGMVAEVNNYIDTTRFLSDDDMLQKALAQSNRIYHARTLLNNSDTSILSTDQVRTRPVQLDTRGGDIPLLHHELKKRITRFWNKKGYELFTDVSIFNRYGVPITAASGGVAGSPLGEEWWLKARDRGYYIGHLEVDDRVGSYSIPMVVRVVNEKEAFIGMIKIGVLVSAVFRETEIASRIYRSTEIKLICNDRQELIYSTDIHRFKENVSGKPYFSHLDAGGGFYSGSEGGVEKLFSYTGGRNRDPEWLLLISHDINEILKLSRWLKVSLVLVSLVLIGFGFVLSVIMSRSIITPLATLTEGAKTIEAGDLSHRVSIQSTDETAALAHAFNEMTERRQEVEIALKTSYNEMEDRVTERTSQLSAANSLLQKEIQERQDAELAFSKSQKQFKAIFEKSPLGIALINSQTGRFIEVNEKLCSITGFSREKMLVLQFQQLTHPEDLQEDLNNMERLKKKEISSFSMEKRYRCRDGDIIWVSLKVVPLWEQDSQLNCHLAITEDITARRKNDEERLHLLSQLQQSQKMETIGTLAGGVAHEINNPINGIMNYAQLIMDMANNNTPLTEYAGEIIQETERVATIIKGLLKFAREENSSHGSTRYCVIVKSVLQLIQSTLREDRIKLEVDMSDDLPAINCHHQQIQQVIMNLITNARDALNDRYAGYDENKKIRISVFMMKKAGLPYIRTTIEDCGSGITDENRDKLFDPFFTTKPRTSNTGLGLSISYGIAMDHHGELSFESARGRYTRFHLDLPVSSGSDSGAAI